MIQEFFNLKLYEIDTDLCKIMNNHGSDKGSGHHNYTKLYDFIFKEIKNEVQNVFELGLGTNNLNIPSNMSGLGVPCGSLRGWREYFPNAEISGADIDTEILIKENRISTYYCDQTNPESISNVFNYIGKEFDIIIEDGLHTFRANKIFFENSIKYLKKGGFFIIEDIDISNFNEFLKFTEEFKNKYNFIDLVQIPNPLNKSDNNIILVKK